MVAPISVFPDVGGAFFGSYRGARQARLQEQAMRAQMAALRADRERESRARGAFAELQSPDQVTTPDRVGGVIGTMGTRLREAGVDFSDIQAPTERVVREGLAPQQRAQREQELAGLDPDLYAAYSASRGSGEQDYGINDNVNQIAQVAISRLAAGNMPPEAIVGPSFQSARMAGFRGSPQDWTTYLQGGVAPEQARPSNRALMADEMGLEGQDRVDFIGQTGRYAPRSNAPQIHIPASPEDIQIVPQETVERLGLDPNAEYEYYRDAQGNTRVRPIAVPGGGSRGGGSGAPAVGGDVLDDLASQVRRNVTSMDEAIGNYVAMSREAGNTEVSPEYARLAISHRLSNEAMGFEQANTIARHSFEADSAVRRQLRALDEIYNVSAEWGNLASGLGANLAFIRGTPAAQVKAYLENVTSQEIVDQLREMREYAQSIGERGSGFGQLTQNEIRIMEAMQTLLGQDMSPERLRREAEAFARELHFARSERMRAMELFMPEVYSEFSAIQGRYDSFRSPEGQGDQGGGENYDGWERF